MEPGFQVGDWQVQPDIGTITRGDEQIQLEPKVMEVLVYLTHHPGDVLPKERIIRAVWPDTFVTDEVLTNAISELRKAFRDDAKNPGVIQTLPRRGYRLIAEVALPAKARVGNGRRLHFSWALVLAGFLTLVVGGWFVLKQRGQTSKPTNLRSIPLTSYPGWETSPSFSPDGSQVAFEWERENQDNADIWVKQIGVEPSKPLTEDPAADMFPVWSPEG
jgi:DNA-binding winged helix-turn-helix (wHTH) protein